MVKDDKIYPHISKPWMKYYKDVKDIDKKDPEVCITTYLKNVNRGNEKLIAQSYYGNEDTYKEYFEKVDRATRILYALGVRKGDTIMNLTPNIPETGELFLGANQLGAISDYIDPRPDSMDIKANSKKTLELLKYEKADHIIALDLCYLGMLKPIENELKDMGIKNIILLNATDSMNLGSKISYFKDVVAYNKIKNSKLAGKDVERLNSLQVLRQRLKQASKTNKALDDAIKKSPFMTIYKWSEIKGDFNLLYKPQVIDEPDIITYIGHTSGTSGARPKPITATNRQSISQLEQLRKTGVNFDKGDTVLHILPYFAPFGAYNNFALNLSSGATNIEVPEFDISEFGYLLKKYHPNIVMTTPAWLVAIAKCEYLQNEDLSCIKKALYGGDSMTPQDETLVNDFLKRRGSNAKVEKGYGMSETLGCASYAKGEYNRLGSIGIPITNTTFAIVNPDIEDRLEPLCYTDKQRLRGELAISSDAVTGGKMNEDIVVPHYTLDGKDYIRTRDIVEVDKNGIFYHQARKDRSFARFDGYKYKPYEVEKIILNNPDVENVMIVDYFDEDRRGIMPICHVVLKDDVDKDEEEIVKEIVYNQIISDPNLSSRQIPSKFKFRKSIPQTKNGKGDFNALRAEALDDSEINVLVNETNLVVDKIEIYRNNKGIVRSRKE